jgi:hypothetical protein
MIRVMLLLAITTSAISVPVSGDSGPSYEAEARQSFSSDSSLKVGERRRTTGIGVGGDGRPSQSCAA